MKLGAHTACLHDKPLPEALEILRDLGLCPRSSTRSSASTRTSRSTSNTKTRSSTSSKASGTPPTHSCAPPAGSLSHGYVGGYGRLMMFSFWSPL
jgi:hypothetical protein